MKTLIAVLVATSLAGTPAAASVRDAALANGADAEMARTSVFLGAAYRIGLNDRTAGARGRASLGVAGVTRTATSELRFGHGLELTTGATGKPTLFIAGQDIGELESRAKLNGTTTAIIIGGVLLLGVAAAVAVSEYDRSQRCIGEEGDCD